MESSFYLIVNYNLVTDLLILFGTFLNGVEQKNGCHDHGECRDDHH